MPEITPADKKRVDIFLANFCGKMNGRTRRERIENFAANIRAGVEWEMSKKGTTTPPEPRALTAEVKSIAFEWTGDLDDDCFCEWNGLSLHAEAMGPRIWWWAVYRGNDEIASSNDEGGWTCGKNGEMARRFAEHAAMRVQLVAALGIEVKHG